MKNVLSSIAIAFAMYSKVPMPRVDWEKSRMQYVMIFFPFVGGLIGGCVFAVLYFGNIIGVSPLLLSCILVALPILITGGIHFDGYMDTVDAISSYATRERRLEILKDPHVGAFGVIYAIVYILLMMGGFLGMSGDVQGVIAIVLCFVLSRILSGIGACNFKSANSGSLSAFKDASANVICNASLFSMLAILVGIFGFFCGWFGAIVIAVQLVWFGVYKRKMYKIFGGVTGDTAGYFLQIAELLSILSVAILGAFL